MSEDLEEAWRCIDRIQTAAGLRPWDRWIGRWAGAVIDTDHADQAALERDRHERDREYADSRLSREAQRVLRGELVAQPVVARLQGERDLLRWYIDALEAFVTTEVDLLGVAAGQSCCRLVLPADLVLLRRLAFGVPVFDGRAA